MTANVYANEVDRMQWDARLAGMDVRFEYNPKSHVYYAYDDRTFDGDPTKAGQGLTQEAALDDLAEKLEDA